MSKKRLMICKHTLKRCVKTNCVHKYAHEEMEACPYTGCGYGFTPKSNCRPLKEEELIMEAYS